jgi:hypothetical protein
MDFTKILFLGQPAHVPVVTAGRLQIEKNNYDGQII